MKSERSRSGGLRGVPVIVCVAALLLPATASAADEVHVYGIANFGGSGQCGKADMTHSVHTSTAAAFRAPFELLQLGGLWDEISTRNNSSARGTYFTDASKNANGDDHAAGSGADEADVIYVHTHGGHDLDGTALSMGNASYMCEVRTDSHMLFGQGGAGHDLDIAVIKACQSGDYQTWKLGGYGPDFTDPSSGFTVWNAFHGDSSCGGHVTSYVGDYSATSMNNGVGENWLDEAYDGAFWWWEYDDCPVSIVSGSSKSARKTMYEWGGFRDRKNTGSKTGSTYFYVAGCDPDHGVKLPE